jgi:hypothetical protein
VPGDPSRMDLKWRMLLWEAENLTVKETEEILRYLEIPGVGKSINGSLAIRQNRYFADGFLLLYIFLGHVEG